VGRKMSVEDLIKDCISKSAFLKTYPVDQLLNGFYDYMNNSITDENMEDEKVFNSGFYSGYNICANIEDMTNQPEKYFIEEGQDIQIPMEEGSYDKYQIFEAPNHSSGIQATIVAEHLQDMYDDLTSMKINDVSDITVDVVRNVAGNLFSVDLIPKPTRSFYREKDLDIVTKIIRDDVLMNLGIKVGSSVAVIGGDKSSASGRRRSYTLDCYYYQDPKMYYVGRGLRKDRKISGQDYLSNTLEEMLDEIKKHKYDCFTFNYCDYLDDMSDILDYFKSQNIPGYGIFIDPDYNDEDICSTQEPRDHVEGYILDTNKMDKYGVQVVTAPVERFVHFCTTHGFVWEKMMHDTCYIQGIKFSEYVFNRGRQGHKKLKDYIGYKSLNHFKIFVTMESVGIIKQLYLRSEINIQKDYCDVIKNVKVENNKLIIDNKEICVLIPAPSGTVVSYIKSDIDGIAKFVDIDLPFNFYSRVLFLERCGLKTVYYENTLDPGLDGSLKNIFDKYIFPYNHNFSDFPYRSSDSLIEIIKYRELDFKLKQKDLFESLVCNLVGVGYNPQTKKLTYNDRGRSYILLDQECKFKKLKRVSFIEIPDDKEYKMILSEKGDFCVFGSNLVFSGVPIEGYFESLNDTDSNLKYDYDGGFEFKESIESLDTLDEVVGILNMFKDKIS